jgi:hypothetical protein
MRHGCGKIVACFLGKSQEVGGDFDANSVDADIFGSDLAIACPIKAG